MIYRAARPSTHFAGKVIAGDDVAAGVQISGAAVTPIVEAVGDAANIALILRGKGTGAVEVSGQLVTGGTIYNTADGGFVFNGRTVLTSPIDGSLRITNNAATAGVLFNLTTDGILKLRDRVGNSGGVLELLEMTAPAVAPADSVRLFARDNGAGKTQLMAIFATGAAVQVAIEV